MCIAWVCEQVPMAFRVGATGCPCEQSPWSGCHWMPLELELYVVVRLLTLVLGNKLRSSARSA